MPLGDPSQRVHVARSWAALIRRGEQPTTDGNGSPTFFLAEIPIATAHREPVRFPNGWHGDDLDGKIEISCHATHHRALLKILLPEQHDVRMHHVEQLAYDGC